MIIAALLAGCLTIDGFLFNPVHCSEVDASTCADKGYWDAVCLSCEEPYDWQRDYEWMEGTLAEDQDIRPIPDGAVSRHVVVSGDGQAELDVYVFSGHGEEPRTAGRTILYSHGNYAGLEHYAPRLRLLYEGGWDIVAWDYRGYGKSEPAEPPTGQQLIDDGLLLFDWTVQELGLDPAELLVYGYSLGAIPSVEVALQRGPCALLLEAPFTSVQDLQASNTGLNLPGGLFSSGLFENTDKLQGHEGPTLVMGGSADQIFTPEDFRQLHQGLVGPSELWLLDGVGHGITGGGVPEAGWQDWQDALLQFVEGKTGCG